MKAVMSKNLKATLEDEKARNALREHLSGSLAGPFNVRLHGQDIRFKIGSVEQSRASSKKN